MKHILFLLLVAFFLVSCGSSKKESHPQGPSGWLRNQKQTNTTRHVQETPDNQKITPSRAQHHLYRLAQESGINLDDISEEAPLDVLVRCVGSELMNFLNVCHLGLNKQDLKIGNDYLNQSQSQDLLENTLDEALKKSLLRGITLKLSCHQDNQCFFK